MFKGIQSEIQPDITLVIGVGELVSGNTLKLLESSPVLNAEVEELRYDEPRAEELRRKMMETEEQNDECWCGPDTICSNCIKRNQLRKMLSKTGFYANGVLYDKKAPK
jgi:hypothetical protein